MIRKNLLILLMVFLVCINTFAATNQYYVAATGGSDGNSGTSVGSPWATCSHAIATFTLDPTNGAQINFIGSSTTFAGCPTINRGGTSNSARLALVCTQQSISVLRCRMSGGFAFGAVNFVDIGTKPLFGFEYTNPSDDNGIDFLWTCATNASSCANGNNNRAFGNNLHDIGQTNTNGCPLSGAILVQSARAEAGGTGALTGIVIEGNLIDHFGINGGSTCGEAHGIYVTGGNAKVRYNIVFRAAASGIQIYGKSCQVDVANNISGESRWGLILQGHDGCTPGFNTIVNNAFVNNSDQGVYEGVSASGAATASTPSLFSNNLFFGNGSGSSNYRNPAAPGETRQNDKTENPLNTFVTYTGTAAGDYHLKTTSIANGGGTTQCVTGGSNCPAVGTNDIYNSIISGNQPIGAALANGSVVQPPPAPTGLTTTVN